MTEDHRLVGLNNRILFLTVLEAGKSKIKVLADPVFGEGTPPGLKMTIFLLYPYMAKRRGPRRRKKERERNLMSVSLLIRALILFTRALPS